MVMFAESLFGNDGRGRPKCDAIKIDAIASEHSACNVNVLPVSVAMDSVVVVVHTAHLCQNRFTVSNVASHMGVILR